MSSLSGKTHFDTFNLGNEVKISILPSIRIFETAKQIEFYPTL